MVRHQLPWVMVRPLYPPHPGSLAEGSLGSLGWESRDQLSILAVLGPSVAFSGPPWSQMEVRGLDKTAWVYTSIWKTAGQLVGSRGWDLLTFTERAV